MLHPPQSFLRLVSKFNFMILRFINRFRENYNKLLGYNNEYDAYNIDTFENILNKCVKRLLSYIMNLSSSKNQMRFKQFVFYLPEELGGLELYNVSILIKYVKSYEQIKKEIDQQGSNQSITTWKQFSQYCNQILGNKIITQYTIQQNKILFPTLFTKDIIQSDSRFINFVGYWQELIQRYPDVNKYNMSNAIFQGTKITLTISDLPMLTTPTKAQYISLQQLPNKRWISYWSPMINNSNISGVQIQQIPNTVINLYGKMNQLKGFYQNLFIGNLQYQIFKAFINNLVWILQNGIQNTFKNIEIQNITEQQMLNQFNRTVDFNLTHIKTILNDNSQLNIQIHFIWKSIQEYDNSQIEQEIIQKYHNFYSQHKITEQNTIYIFIDYVYQQHNIILENINENMNLIQIQQFLQSHVKQLLNIKPMKLFQKRLRKLLQISGEQSDENEEKNIFQLQDLETFGQNQMLFIYMQRLTTQQSVTYQLKFYHINAIEIEIDEITFKLHENKKKFKIQEFLTQKIQNSNENLILINQQEVYTIIQQFIELQNLDKQIKLINTDFGLKNIKKELLPHIQHFKAQNQQITMQVIYFIIAYIKINEAHPIIINQDTMLKQIDILIERFSKKFYEIKRDEMERKQILSLLIFDQIVYTEGSGQLIVTNENENLIIQNSSRNFIKNEVKNKKLLTFMKTQNIIRAQKQQQEIQFINSNYFTEKILQISEDFLYLFRIGIQNCYLKYIEIDDKNIQIQDYSLDSQFKSIKYNTKVIFSDEDFEKIQVQEDEILLVLNINDQKLKVFCNYKIQIQ